MSPRLENAVNVALAIAALTVAAGFIRREFGDKSTQSRDVTKTLTVATFSPKWQELLKDGLQFGPPAATVKIIELEFSKLHPPVSD